MMEMSTWASCGLLIVGLTIWIATRRRETVEWEQVRGERAEWGQIRTIIRDDLSDLDSFTVSAKGFEMKTDIVRVGVLFSGFSVASSEEEEMTTLEVLLW